MSDIRKIDTRDGPMVVLARDVFITRALALYGEYCPDEAAMLRQLVRPGQTVVEVGANMGSHTISLARACAPGFLHAFEPQRRVFQVLCANLALNDIANVVAYPDASGETSGFAAIPEIDYSAVGNFGGVSVTEVAEWSNARTVRVTPIDDLPLEACHLIKVDVEGWEMSVLKGAEQTIARYRPILYVENDRVAHQQALISQISAYGYRLYWHVPALFSPNNYNRVEQNIFGRLGSLNMLCLPTESEREVRGLQPIDPDNWTSPFSAG